MLLLFFIVTIFSSFDFAYASNGFDFGDSLALILGLIIGSIGFFACMGAYARRKSRLESL